MQAKQVLHKLLQKACSEMHKLRRTALFVNVTAALHGEVLTVTHLGRSITSEAKKKHCIKRADRLLSNRRLQGERVGIYSAVSRRASRVGLRLRLLKPKVVLEPSRLVSQYRLWLTQCPSN